MGRGCLSSCLGAVCFLAVLAIVAGGGGWSLVAGLVFVCALAGIVGIVLGTFEGIVAGLFGRR